MLRILNIAVPSILLVIAIVLLAVTFTDQFDVPTFGGDVGPAFAPRGFLIVWAVLALIATIEAVRAPAEDDDADDKGPVKTGQLAAVILIAAGTALAMINIGFVFAAIPGFFLFCWAFGYRRIVPLTIISIAGPIAIWALFTFGFELLLPRSPWFHTL